MRAIMFVTAGNATTDGQGITTCSFQTEETSLSPRKINRAEP